MPSIKCQRIRRKPGSLLFIQLQTSFNRENNKLAKLVSHSRYLSFENVSIKVPSAKLVSLNPKHQRTTFNNVINLSSLNITIAEETLLNRGLSFCPTSRLDEVKLDQST